MPISLRDVSPVALFHRLDSMPSAGAEHRYADLACKDVLPFIGRGMPVQLSERAGFEIKNYASHRCRDRKIGGINSPLFAAFIDAVRLLFEKFELVSNGRLVPPLKRRRLLLRRQGALSEVHFLLGKPVQSGHRDTEILRH